MATQLRVDWQALDRLVVALPVHVLYFDGGLICRYAAPAGPHFLGQTPDRLLGAPATEVFPAELRLTAPLQQVLATQQPWQHEQVLYPAGPQEAWPAGAWAVHLQPWTLGTVTAAAPATQDRGVLVSCLPCTEAKRWAAAIPDCGSGHATGRLAVLYAAMRNQLTVMRGFAGLLRRRQQRTGGVDAVVTQIEQAAVALGELVDQCEYPTADQQEETRP